MNVPVITVNTMSNADSFFEEGPYEAMRKLAGIGYHCVEISQHIQLTDTTLPQILHAMHDFNIEVCAISARFGGSFFIASPPLQHEGKILKSYSAEQDFDVLVQLCRTLNCHIVRFAGISALRFHTLEDLKKYLLHAEDRACRFAEKGILLCAHNHTEEFTKLEGKMVLEWALHETSHLGFELDVYNAQCSGVTPSKLIESFGSRAVLLHLRDDARPLDTVPANKSAMEPRQLSLQSVCRAAAAAQCRYLVVEQENLKGCDPYDSLEKSLQNLKRMVKTYC